MPRHCRRWIGTNARQFDQLFPLKNQYSRKQKRADEHKPSDHVYEPYRRHQKGCAAPGDNKRIVDVVAGEGKHHDRQEYEPVRDSDWQFPHINPHGRKPRFRPVGFTPPIRP